MKAGVLTELPGESRPKLFIAQEVYDIVGEPLSELD